MKTSKRNVKFFLTPAMAMLFANVFSGNRPVQADAIPYPDRGHYNPVTYAFTAATTGDVIGYFAGTDATYENKAGLLDDGVLTSAGYGLDDHKSSIGTSFDFGRVNAGDTLTFVLDNITLGSFAYSDPSLNVSYDTASDTLGHNHLYSTQYTATSPVFAGVPAGTFVAFEDQRFPSSDFSYDDENFVFTNVRSSVPEPAGLASAGAGAVLFCRRSRRAKPRERTADANG
jgi:hypothetical protein